MERSFEISARNATAESRRFHGEFKTPGGKLVVVDFRLCEDLLHDVQISGDFFLYPEDALHRLCAALERSPAAASKLDRIARLSDSLMESDELVGITSESIAIAVERAFSEAR